MAKTLTEVPTRPDPPYDCMVTHRADGAWLMEPKGRMREHPARLTDRLVHWAAVAPDRTFIAQRDAQGEWVRLSYGETLAWVRRIGAGLLARKLSPERPIAILSGSSIEHQVLALAAMYVGIPFVPVSTAYSLTEGALGRLRYVLSLMTPGVIAVFGGPEYQRAVQSIEVGDAEWVTLTGAEYGMTSTALAALSSDDVAAADAAHERVGPDTIVKFLLTSGSTGNPKAVITTHRMLMSNQATLLQAMPFLSEEPPVIVDWLPWNHVFGGSHNIGIVLMNGGTYYIDAGKPTPAGIKESVRNLREISPTIYLNVPRGYEALLPFLLQDAGLRENFFKRLRTTFVAAAGLSQEVWNGYLEVSRQARGETVPMINGLGATETAPSVTFATNTSRAGFIGLPAAGCQVKLVPINGKLEIRVRGPMVTPGYWRDPGRTAASYDEEGWYRMGDAVRFADPDDPAAGLMFDGRIAEDFKLSSGTWVSVGPLRVALLTALSPLCADVVIAGLNRDGLGALLVPDMRGCATFFPQLPADITMAQLAQSPVLLAELKQRLDRFAVDHPGSSTSIARALVLDSPPGLGSGELTDKGGINQRAVLDNRAHLVDALYAREPGPEVICIATA
jgi:feruloyl-CoA synthase